MDNPFDPAKWKPTLCPPASPRPSDMSPETLETLMRDLITETKYLMRHPYDPRCWFARSIVLSRLQYPELALGDAIKSGMLCDGLLDRLDQGDRRTLGYRCGFWMLDAEDTPEDSDADKVKEALVICIKSLREYALRIERICTKGSEPGEEHGQFIPREYPWMDDRHRGRSDDLIAQFNSVFAYRAPRSSKADGPLCELRRHAFGEDSTGSIDTSDILGVFALRDIPKHTLVLIDRTQHFGCNGPIKRGSEIDWSDSSSCPDVLHPNLSDDSTDHSLQWIRDEAGLKAADVLLTCRFLLGCVVRPEVSHPLDSVTIASLTPKYHETKPSSFLREEDYILPIRYLQQIGVDIFADLQYDTWVIFTLQARIENNSCESSIHACVHPLFSFFNHSCDPNLTWTMKGRDKTHNSMMLQTQRDIFAGEQLFVEYDSFVHDKSLAKRRERLRKWFDADCLCTRCVKEEAEISALQEAIGKREIVVPDTSAWDTEVKPVLPEDSLLDSLRAMQVPSGVI